MDWQTHARRLADDAVRPESRWHSALAGTPRHLFVPRWWGHADDGSGGWVLRDGPADTGAWLKSAYADTTLVTRVGTLHADEADQHTAQGRPTSSSTLPTLVVTMYRHAFLRDDSRTLVVTGSGYGTALACARLRDRYVTSVDVDPHVVRTAGERLDTIGLHPTLAVCDITGELPGRFDRIVSTVAVESVPASWLRALNPGGRLVTTLAGTGLLVTADKTDDGGATGRVEWDRAAFMVARHGADYPPQREEMLERIRSREGDAVSRSPYPVVDVRNGWELWSTFAVHHPRVEHWYEETDGHRTAWMAHPDGSWARATGTGTEPAEVHQGGPLRLWDELDRIRRWWLADGYLNTYGARVTVTLAGVTTLARGGWAATLG
ncbi:protein-L-isoaspartate(D-aspartate) O-methyltransferase [Streptomyces sp. ME18-1-4]|uniref:protein-L-isoaspartate(D-aspartate) O-methyltransferase n=1 Tax=Streptomyces sp. ME18-1-4 TaxID=3028685 RepID=UPI0029BA4C2C|nr:protein-L-isoaspartate(D-aspartate) O-methyltransferase [Streptomyces sp. ME18-1-4]MDX3248617.1 protein-L-isoaspartate(D-aspartate) O-methyltransferase [Streptomyces sp. ME18-1-4]